MTLKQVFALVILASVFAIFSVLPALSDSPIAHAQDSGGEKKKEGEKKPGEEGSGEEGEEGSGESAESEALSDLIRENLGDLTAGTATLDGTLLTVTYSPEAVREEAEWIGKEGSEHIRWSRSYYFSGENKGHFLFKPRYKGKVKIETTIHYQWINRGGHFMILSHVSKDGFYGSNFGVHTVSQIGKKKLKMRPSKFKEHKRDPSYWLDRTTSQKHILVVDSLKKELKTSFSGLVNELDLGKKPLEGGRVGLRWDDVTFRVHSITVTGELDREWAAKVIGGKPRSEEE